MTDLLSRISVFWKNISAGDVSIFGLRVARTTAIINLAAILLFFGFILWFAYSNPAPAVRSWTESDPLVPGAALALLPGEEYGYTAFVNGDAAPQPISFLVAPAGGGCTGVTMRANGQTLAHACYDSRGRLVNPATGRLLSENETANSTGTNVFFFQPWMLNADENLTWRVRLQTSIGGLPPTATTLVFRGAAPEMKRGRLCYPITMYLNDSLGEQPIAQHWIDAEKRVLVEMDSAQQLIVLTKAPFPVE